MNKFSKIFLVGAFLFSLLFTACQEKKETAAPAAQPAVAEKAPKAGAPDQPQGIDKKDQEEINKIQDMIK
ncbi:MAG: hypothetical protein M1511_04300 [Deltaproteobacteria bacterium]|nr:hypothetical protein [Deltaproteobacteria bacterium]